jgi:hypothetical protein
MKKSVVLVVGAALIMATGGTPVESRPLPQPIDPTPANCSVASFSPAAVHVPVADPADEITIDLFMVGDRGISSSRLIELVQQAEKAYAPLGIRLRVVGTQEVVFTGTHIDELFAQTKALFPRQERPSGSDAVILVTSVDLSFAGGSGVAGVADCVGGIEFPGKALALVEANDPDAALRFGPVTFFGFTSAKILAHELAHLVGAHHQYANCVEGNAYELQEAEASPCTLMFNDIGLVSLGMSALEGAVARGYADLYARP